MRHKRRGLSSLTVVALVFVVLKLTGVIDWSWWWVLAPIWLSWLIILALIFIIGAGWLIVTGFKTLWVER